VRRTGVMIAQGLPIALLLFVLFPRLAGPLWGLPKDAGVRTGLSNEMSPGMISELSLSDAVAFRVDFLGSIPAAHDRYWRGPVLSAFDGRTWPAMPTRLGNLVTPEGGPVLSYVVSLEPSGHPWLFALGMPVSLPILDDPNGAGSGEALALARLTREQQLVLRASVTQPVRYLQRSVLRHEFPVASPRDADYIRAVLQYFRDEGFVYTLAPPLYEHEPVDEFLFGERRGFCEHYASAFVVLLRAAGIPARVVTGYQGGEINPRGGYMIVRQSDAHAWSEALVDGVWQRFDPTAAVAPSRIERGIAGALPDSEPLPRFARLSGGWLKNMQLALDALNHAWRRDVIGFNSARQRELWRAFDLTARTAPWA